MSRPDKKPLTFRLDLDRVVVLLGHPPRHDAIPPVRGQMYAMPVESRRGNICIYSPRPSEPVAIPALRHDGCAPFEGTVLGVADPGAPQVRVTHELPHLVGSAAETDVREHLVEILLTTGTKPPLTTPGRRGAESGNRQFRSRVS